MDTKRRSVVLNLFCSCQLTSSGVVAEVKINPIRVEVIGGLNDVVTSEHAGSCQVHLEKEVSM